MDHGYKITTHGRKLLAACGDLERPLRLTRAAVGSGRVDTDEDLAKVHDLVQYAAEASITDRRHEEDRLFLPVRYSNQDNPELGAFALSEFMVWAEDPETGQETDFLYATLGDFCLSVPGYKSRITSVIIRSHNNPTCRNHSLLVVPRHTLVIQIALIAKGPVTCR